MRWEVGETVRVTNFSIFKCTVYVTWTLNSVNKLCSVMRIFPNIFRSPWSAYVATARFFSLLISLPHPRPERLESIVSHVHVGTNDRKRQTTRPRCVPWISSLVCASTKRVPFSSTLMNFSANICETRESARDSPGTHETDLLRDSCFFHELLTPTVREIELSTFSESHLWLRKHSYQPVW